MWDLPGPEIELVLPALAGGFLTIGPLGILCTFKTPCASHLHGLSAPHPSSIRATLWDPGTEKVSLHVCRPTTFTFPSMLLICTGLIIFGKME